MTESIGIARLDIVVDTSSVDAGVSKAKRSTQDMAKAAQDASQKMDTGTKRQVAALERQIATLGKSRSEVIRWRIEQQTSGRVAEQLTAKLDAQERRLSTMDTALGRIGSSAKRLAATWIALGAAAMTAAISFGVKNAVDFADKLNDINIRLGISAETLSSWAYAAQQTGTDIDGLGNGLKRLARNMAEALDPQSAQFRVFDSLGVSVKDAQGNLRSLEGVLPEIATGFQKIENETLKAALAQELFGKSGTDLIEFLSQGESGLAAFRDRARELGVELNGGALTAADEFNDTLADLRTASQGLFLQLSQALLPEMTKLVAKLTELVSDSDRTRQFVSDLSTVVSGTAKVFEFAAGQVSVMTSQLAALKTVADGVIGLDWSQINRGLAMGMAAQSRVFLPADRLLSGGSPSPSAAPAANEGVDFSLGAPMTAEERRAFERRVQGGLVSPDKERKGRTGKSDAEKEAERLQQAYANLAEQQRERIALFGQEGEAAKVRYDVEFGALQNLSAEKKRELIANAERLDQMREEDEFAKKQARADAEHAERFKGLLDDMRTESDLLGKSIEQQDEYIKLKYLGAEANDAERQAVIEGNKAYHERLRLISAQTELMDTFRSEASSALSDVITGTKSLSDAFKDMFDNIAERITQMIADRWIEQLFGQMGTTDSGAAGNWFSSFMGALANANGNVFSRGEPVQAFANGGVVSGPTFFPMRGSRVGLMGEAGPEAIVPLARGSDGKLGIRMEGGSQRPVVNNHTTFVLPALVTPQTQAQIAQRQQQSASRATSRNL